MSQYGLVLIMAIITILGIERAPLVEKMDAVLFNFGTQFLNIPQKTEDKTIILTLPEPVSTLSPTSNLISEFTLFLEKLEKIQPAAVAIIFERFPQKILNENLIKIESRIKEDLSKPETKDVKEIREFYSYIQGLVGAGEILADTLIKNDILVAVKPQLLSGNTELFSDNFLGYPPYSDFNVDDPLKRTFLQILPKTGLPQKMPTIGVSPEYPERKIESLKLIPLFSHHPHNTKWPLVWKYENQYLPDLVTLLYAKYTKSAPPIWIVNRGVQYDYLLIKTDFSGRLRPLFLSKKWKNLPVKQIAFSEISVSNKLKTLKNKIVLIGTEGDPALKETALALASLSTESTVYTPVWGIWLAKGAVFLFAAYLFFLLHRLNSFLGTLLSITLIILTVAVQLFALVTQSIWFPFVTPIIFMVVSFPLMQSRINSRNRIKYAEKLADNTLFKLGKFQFEEKKIDQAFATFKECMLTQDVLNMIYDIGDEYQKRNQLIKARNVFGYIHHNDQEYEDSKERLDYLTNFLEGNVSEKNELDSSQTQNIATFELQRSVLGRYEIERELGRGAMGTVFLGRDPKIGRHVAVKTLNFIHVHSDMDNMDEVKERFFREATAIGRLSHPNIVTVYDVGEEEDLAFIAMDYAEGKTLKFYADKNNLLPIQTVYSITAQVADALDYAHNQNVIHRDIKPGNIIYSEENNLVKVTDFGIARITDTAQITTNAILGSPSYMSPEQLKQSSVDGRADIFSLGVTFFQLLTGQFPFKGEDLAGITYQITNSPHPDIRKIRSDIPNSASRIINKALQKPPEKRYQTAKKMAEALRKGMP